MYLLANPHTGKKNAAKYAQLEFIGSTLSPSLAFKSIGVQKNQLKKNDQKTHKETPREEEIMTENHISAEMKRCDVYHELDKLLEYCDKLKNGKSEQQQNINFPELERVCIYSAIGPKEYDALMKKLSAWIDDNLVVFTVLDETLKSLVQFMDNIRLIFNYCWNIDNYNVSKSVTLEKRLVEEMKRGLRCLLINYSFLDLLQKCYDNIVSRVLDDQCSGLSQLVGLLRSIHNLEIFAVKLDLTKSSHNLNVKPSYEIIDLEKFLSLMDHIKAFEFSCTTWPVILHEANQEYYIHEFMCDMVDLFFQSEPFYSFAIKLNDPCLYYDELTPYRKYNHKIRELLDDARYETRGLNFKVRKAVQKKILDLCLQEDQDTNYCAFGILIYFNKNLHVQPSNFYLDENSFEPYYEYILRNDYENKSTSLLENFKRFLRYMSPSTQKELVNYLFNRITEAANESLVLITESTIRNTTKLLNVADILSDYFTHQQITQKMILKKNHKELVESSYKRSFVELKTVHYEKDATFQLLKSKKVKIPATVRENLKSVLNDIKSGDKKVRLNTSYNTVQLDYNYEVGTCHITCSAFVAVTLLAFEKVNKISFEELQRKTEMESTLLRSCVDSLKNARLLFETKGMIRLNTSPDALKPSLLII